MSRNLDPFYSAKLPFRGLHADIENIKIRAETFVQQRHAESFAELDPTTGELVVKIRLLEDVPDNIERDAVRYLSEIRSALDKAINGSAAILGSRSLKHTNFPFGDASGGKTAFERQLNSEKGIWRGIPVELHSYLKELRPYPGGCDLLAMLGEMSNPAKHESRLFVSVQIDGIFITKCNSDLSISFIGEVWNEAHDECEVMRMKPTKAYFEFVAPLQISFNTSSLFPYKDFSGLLGDMARMAESIVIGVEAKTAEALKSRQ